MQRAVKRLFDIFFSALALLLLLPAWIVIGLWIALTSKGGVFFRQKRTGYCGRDFDLLKFRSMYVNAEADTTQAADSDRRVTPIGRFLRRSSLDELPQLINVLKGDMSIIGPRPHMLYHTQQYSKLIPDYMRRHEMRPGLTGYAQISGFRGPTPRLEDMENRVRADIYYVDHFSLWLDLRIFSQTIWRMLLLKL